MLFNPQDLIEGNDEEHDRHFWSRVNSRNLLPLGEAFPAGAHRHARVVVLCGESGQPDEGWIREVGPQSSDELASWVGQAHQQYLGNISPQPYFDRTPQDDEEFQFCSGFKKWTVERFRLAYKESGILPFLLIRTLVFCQAERTVCIDFDCEVDIYLSDYEFSFDVSDGSVRFVTPRHNHMVSSYPAQ